MRKPRSFRSHYGIDDPFYCIPGIEGAHEKGGVEGQIGYYRRNHFVPVPSVNSIDELNARVDQWDIEELGRRIGARARTIGELFAVEAPTLKRLPVEEFETGSWLATRVDRYSMVAARTNKYSVPIRFIGRPVRILLHASWLVVYDGRTEIAHRGRPGMPAAAAALDPLPVRRHRRGRDPRSDDLPGIPG